jgi:hypothetical protein
LTLRGFSKAALTDMTVSGTLTCELGGDAACEGSSDVTAVGCTSASACTPGMSETQRDVVAMPPYPADRRSPELPPDLVRRAIAGRR